MAENATTGGIEDFESRLNRLDLSLWGHIESETTERDRRSLLALHFACRQAGQFAYLEIGSYLGGSLQSYVVDPRCTRIISIDPRPASQPDARGILFDYPANSTQLMFEHLATVPGADVTKVEAIESSTADIPPESITVRPRVCFIDGEHTVEAASRDARFCLSVADPNGCIVFHDANIVGQAISAFAKELKQKRSRFRSYRLLDSVAVFELGSCDFRRALVSNRAYAQQRRRSVFRIAAGVYRRMKATWHH
jgi:hypothetical protein